MVITLAERHLSSASASLSRSDKQICSMFHRGQSPKIFTQESHSDQGRERETPFEIANTDLSQGKPG